VFVSDVFARDGLSFDERVELMRRISQGEETYGQRARPHEQANEYYLDHLMDDCVERALRECPEVPARVDLLISLSGFSPATTVLTYEMLRPRRLVVVSSADATDSIDSIAERVIGRGRLRQSEFTHRSCEPTDPLGIYWIVQNELDEHTKRHDGVAVAYLDITGGRKVMSAAAALAAWQLDLELCYIESRWDPGLRQPIPGSDRLLLLENPTSLFGAQEMSAAQHMFDGGAFDAARLRFEELAARLTRPARARFMAALSELYRAWCDLDLPALRPGIERVQNTLGPIRRDLPVGTVAAVEEQLRFLERLAARDQAALLLGFHLLDDHYRAIGRQDFAALLSYRTIEGCLVERLKARSPGFDDSEPDYELLMADSAELRRRWSQAMDEVDQRPKRRSLPPYVGFFAAAVLLHVLEDPLLPAAGICTINDLRALRDLAKIRNASVLAHGHGSVSRNDSERLNGAAKDIMKSYWRLQDDGDAGLDELLVRLRFVRMANHQDGPTT
jgi:CRISPR-associated protein (TIGR02710 family)